VPQHGGAGGARSPILTGHVLVRWECLTVRLRAGQYVVHVGRVAAAIDHRALLGQSRLLSEHVCAMQFVEVARDECPLGIVPGPMADAVAGVDGRRPGLRAQIGVPGARARSDRGGERLAARVGAREAAQVAALARAGAGDEEARSRALTAGAPICVLRYACSLARSAPEWRKIRALEVQSKRKEIACSSVTS